MNKVKIELLRRKYCYRCLYSVLHYNNFIACTNFLVESIYTEYAIKECKGKYFDIRTQMDE